MKRINFDGKRLTFVLGSFIVIAPILIVYFHAPPLAVLLGGLLAIIIAIASKKSRL